MTEFIAVIAYVYRLNNSVNGNPRYRVHFEQAEDIPLSAITQSDAAVGYDVPNLTMSKNKGKPVNVTLSRAGRITGMKLV